MQPMFCSALPSSCEWAVPLLKFYVCRDAAVCAGGAGGFLCVLEAVRKGTRTAGTLSFRPDPLEIFERDCGENALPHRFLAPRKGDNEWLSTMWRLSGAVRAVTSRRFAPASSA